MGFWLRRIGYIPGGEGRGREGEKGTLGIRGCATQQGLGF